VKSNNITNLANIININYKSNKHKLKNKCHFYSTQSLINTSEKTKKMHQNNINPNALDCSEEEKKKIKEQRPTQ
jgi:hypothetical protein